MLPRLVISSSKEARKKYTENAVKELQINANNLFFLEPEGGTLSIEQTRSISSLFLTKFDKLRIIVIDSFDLATTEAQNSLLKLLEEKTGNALFILFVANAEAILSTIRSRAQIVPLKEERSVKKQTADLQKLFENLDNYTGYGHLGDSHNQLKTKEETLDRIDDLIHHYEELLLRNAEPGSASILKKALAVRHQIQSYNANPQLAYDNLLIFISKLASMKMKA